MDMDHPYDHQTAAQDKHKLSQQNQIPAADGPEDNQLYMEYLS
jgi:hypothetical protein